MKGAAATRQRRLQLQISYGRALMRSKGFGAAETKAAFTRAKELAASTPALNDSPHITVCGLAACCAASWRRHERRRKFFCAKRTLRAA